jgi:hypothetical protein
MYGDFLVASGQPVAAAAYYERALEIAGSMSGPRLRAEVQDLIESTLKLEALRAEMKAAMGKAWPLQEGFDPLLPAMLPRDLVRRFWSGGTAAEVPLPWRDETWLARHRSAVVKGLTAKRDAARKKT